MEGGKGEGRMEGEGSKGDYVEVRRISTPNYVDG